MNADMSIDRETFSATPGEVMLFILRTTRRHWGFFVFMFFIVTSASVCFAVAPIQTKRLVDLITTQPPGAVDVVKIGTSIFLLVGFRLLGGLCYRISGYASAKMVPRITCELEEVGLRGVLAHAHGFFADQHSGSLVRRITRLGDAYNRIHATFYWNILGGVAVGVAVITQLLITRPTAAGLLVVWIAIIALGNVFVTTWKTPVDEERTRIQNKVQGLLADIVSNVMTVKLFAREAVEIQTFQRGLDERIKIEKKAWDRSEHALTGGDVVTALLNGSLLFLVLWWWERGQVTVGDFVLLQSFVVLLTEQLFFIGFAYRDFIEALTNASEIVGILKMKSQVNDVKRAKPLRVKRGDITFSGVNFGYGRTSILSDFSLHVLPKEKVALVGPSGAGKSTVIKLLLRFYDTHHGHILIDGQDIANVTQASLRTQISLVPQDPVLFHRSLHENIAYGRPTASRERVIAAAKRAYCHEFISQLPDGYETLVGERGVKLSGGERQRVAIARAILADAPILILDEATSALDSQSEQLIQKALEELMRDKTVIVIAHRLSTVMGMDRIVVMEEGRITDMGTHRGLLDKMGTYQKLWNLQVGGFSDIHSTS